MAIKVKYWISQYKICVLNAEVRTGKTHITLEIAKDYNNVLFITKGKTGIFGEKWVIYKTLMEKWFI